MYWAKWLSNFAVNSRIFTAKRTKDDACMQFNGSRKAEIYQRGQDAINVGAPVKAWHDP